MSTRRLLADRRARRYLAAQTLSLIGDSAMLLACGIWVKDLTGSDGAAGLTFLFLALPALLAPLAGLLADRLRRGRLLVATNLAGAVVLLPLLAVRSPDQVWLICAVMLLYRVLLLTEAVVVVLAALLLVRADRLTVPPVAAPAGGNRASAGPVGTTGPAAEVTVPRRPGHDGDHDHRAGPGARRPAGAAPSARP
ncbi:hypothetical protein [Micromonospora sp. NPDC023737]|uniref:hypothetical protein n=1 Tax=unclassified Micromonospora TaxID=2617518 RepID=UPI0033D2B68B